MSKKEQKNVIEKFDLLGPAVVEASAGTGKTYTITGLIVRLLLGDFARIGNIGSEHIVFDTSKASRLNLEDILVMTFTNAATNDLKRKIREKIHNVKKSFIAIGNFFQKKLDNDESNILEKFLETLDKVNFDNGNEEEFLKDKFIDSEQAIFDLFEQEEYREARTSEIDLALYIILNKYVFGFNKVEADPKNKLSIILKECSQILANAEQDMDKANISTIHSFCNNIMSKYATALSLPMNFTLQTDIQGFLQDAYLRALRELTYSLKIDELTQNFLNYLNIFQITKGDNNYGDKSALKKFKSYSSEKAVNIQSIYCADTKDEQVIATLATDNKEQLEKYKFIVNTLEDIFDNFEVFKIEKEKKSSQDQEEFGCKYKFNDTKTLFIKNSQSHLGYELVNVDKEFVLNLVYNVLFRKALAILETEKNKDNIITNDDSLSKLYYAMQRDKNVREFISQEVRQLYPVAIIDEFQDTDPIQFGIVQAIYLDYFNSDEFNIAPKNKIEGFYIIGDPKQSIYAFRGAEINSYNDAVNKIKEFSKSKLTQFYGLNNNVKNEFENNKKYVLDTNYRSDPKLVEATNLLFGNVINNSNDNEQIFNAVNHVSEKDKIEFLRVKPKSDLNTASNFILNNCNYNNSPCFINLLQSWKEQISSKSIKYSFLSKEDVRLYYSQISVKQILDVLNNGQIKNATDEWCDVQFKDIAILVSDFNQATSIKKELAKVGIASVYSSEKEQIQDTTEFKAMIDLMSAVLNSRERTYIKSLFLNPCFHLNLDDYEELLSEENNEVLTMFLDDCKKNLEKHGFAAMFANFMNYKDPNSVFLNGLSISEQVTKFLDGKIVLSRLMQSAEIAQFICSKLKSYESLIPVMQELYNNHRTDNLFNELGIDTSVYLPRDENIIRITTYHASKGLEYAIVFLPFAGLIEGKLNFTDILQGYYDVNSCKKQFDLTNSEFYKILHKEEYLKEQYRVWYVAATRAKYAMFINGGLCNDDSWSISDLLPKPEGAFEEVREKVYSKNSLTPFEEIVYFDGLEEKIVSHEKFKPYFSLRKYTLDEIKQVEEELQKQVEEELQKPESIQNSDESSVNELCFNVLDKDFAIDTSWMISSYSNITASEKHVVLGNDNNSSNINLDNENINNKVSAQSSEADNEELNSKIDDSEKLELLSKDQDIELNIQVLTDNLENENSNDGFNRFSFSKGPESGTFLHEVLEKVIFNEDERCQENKYAASLNADERLKDEIRLAFFNVATGVISEKWRPNNKNLKGYKALENWFKDILSTDIPKEDNSTFKLQDISNKDCYKEMEFLMSLYNADDESLKCSAQKLNEVLNNYYKEHDPEMFQLVIDNQVNFADFKGLITGFIDLLIKVDGKFYVVDYKSNHLGNNILCYQKEHLKKAIAGHRYDIQYTLYTVAIHRYLKNIYGDNYDYDQYIGGIRYLFLRGMNKENYNNLFCGVYSSKVPLELIEQVDAVFGGNI